MAQIYFNWICAIVVIDLLPLSLSFPDGNNNRLANPELPPQPLTDGTPMPLEDSQGSTIPTNATDPSAEVNSKAIKVTVTFPRVETWESCRVSISVKGRGIKDSFIGPCWVGGAFSINREDLMIWGDPMKTPITLYSDKRGTMVVILDGHSCVTKKYKFDNGREIVTLSKMSAAKCKELMNKIQDNMDESNKLVSPEETMIGMAVPPDLKKDSFTSKNSEYKIDEVCQKTIQVTGRGIADSFMVSCDRIKYAKMIKFKGGMLVGNPLKDDFSWFSEAWGTSVVVEGGVCILRRYADNSGFMKITLSHISAEECTEAKKRLAEKRSKIMDTFQELSENFKHKIGSWIPAKLGYHTANGRIS